MIAEFVLVSFASFIGWQIFRYFSFFPLSVRLAPLLALCISYGFTYLSHPSVLIAFAATGGVALLNKITDASSPEKLSLPKVNLPKRKDKPDVPPQVGHRIPLL